MKPTPLDRKLLRDLLQMKGQALAIALVIAAGVAMFVTYRSSYHALSRTQQFHYTACAFGDVFASLERAPEQVAARIAALPGVARVATRVAVQVTLDIPDFAEPVRARVESISASARPSVNDLVLRRGRWIEPERSDEVLVSEAFARAHALEPGDVVGALLDGKRRQLEIVGIAFSPEHLQALPPGGLVVDDRRFGIVWMERRALAAAYDLEGAFNEVSLILQASTNVDDVVTELDRMLAPYGVRGATPRRLQRSHAALQTEFAQLQTLSLWLPGIILAIAAFLLNVAMLRALALERPRIAMLKALGYLEREIAIHYLKLALAIAGLGAAIGIVAGGALSRVLLELYNEYFRFPSLRYTVAWQVALGGALLSATAAAIGAGIAIARAVRMPPAEAMREPIPMHARVSWIERVGLQRRLSATQRMLLRTLERHPVRTLSTVAGIAFSIGAVMVGFVAADAMQSLADGQYADVQREDVSITFSERTSARAIHELRSWPGVLHAEPTHAVAARLHFGPRMRQVVLQGSIARPALRRIVDRWGRVVSLDGDGLVLSKLLGERLGVAAGDTVEVELLEGERRRRRVSIAGLVDDALGLSAHMEIAALRRLASEGDAITGVHLLVDAARAPALYAELKRTPKIAAVSITAAARDRFRTVIANNFRVISGFCIAFAAMIAFGVTYNTARISLSERAYELGNMRMLGYTSSEITRLFLGELLVPALIAIPLGALIGARVCAMLAGSSENELYRVTFSISARHVAAATFTVFVAGGISCFAVARKLARMDLPALLKTRM